VPSVRPVPEGFHTVTPHLVVRDARAALDFYGRAFGAEEVSRMPGPDGRLMHSHIRIGDSPLFVVDEFPEWGALGPQGDQSPVTIHLCVEDADATFARAVEAGATPVMPVDLTFWGDRYGKLLDPFGHHWSIATRVEDLTPEQMAERGAKLFA
jgi:uncharacterized glyoxalase superfamily protein PhnB